MKGNGEDGKWREWDEQTVDSGRVWASVNERWQARIERLKCCRRQQMDVMGELAAEVYHPVATLFSF